MMVMMMVAMMMIMINVMNYIYIYSECIFILRAALMYEASM